MSSPHPLPVAANAAGAWSAAVRLSDRLHPFGARAARALLLVATLLGWQSFFWIGSNPLLAKFAFAGLTVLSAWRPADGLLAVAGLAVLGGPVAGLLGGVPGTGAEAIVLAFLAGWIARATWNRERFVGLGDRLGAAAGAFTTLVACSLVVTFVVRQQLSGQPAEHAAFLASLFAKHYLDGVWSELSTFRAAFLLLEGLLLVTSVVALSRRNADLPGRALRFLVLGTSAAAVLSVVRLAMGMLRSDDPMRLFWSTFTGLRLTFHVSDVNAAGSHFAMVIVVVAGLVLCRRRLSWLWSLAWVPLLPGLWLTGSRAAYAAVLVVPWLGLVDRRWRRALLVAGPVAIVGVVVLLAVWPTSLPLTRWSMAQSGASRLSFLEMSWRMWLDAPVWGLGIGEYLGASARYMPADLRAVFFMENAHNNFAQIGVELGLTGLALFLGILWAAFTRMKAAWRIGDGDPLLVGLALGLVTFLATCLVGHPLLVPPVAYAFWLTLGLAVALADRARREAGGSPSPAEPENGPPSRLRTVLGVFVVVMVALVPLRAANAIRSLDMSDVRVGFSASETDTEGERFRWIGPQAAIFVPAGTKAVVLSVSAGAEDDSAVLSLAVNGHPGNRVPIRGEEWQDVDLLMPSTPPPSRFWRLDLDIQPDDEAGRTGAVVTKSGGRLRLRSVTFFPPAS